MNVVTVLLLVAFAAVLLSLIGGVTSMVGGGEAGHHSSEHWMVMRVSFQVSSAIFFESSQTSLIFIISLSSLLK